MAKATLNMHMLLFLSGTKVTILDITPIFVDMAGGMARPIQESKAQPPRYGNWEWHTMR